MCLTPLWLEKRKIYVPCGQCKQCLLKSTYDWAHRIMVEAAHHEQNCVVTLTYNEDNKPSDGLLHYRDVQLFMKRFRKAIAPQTVRFFCSGEYGDEFGRPHYHHILFGYFPDDAVYMFSRHGNKFYKSEYLNGIWGKGFATVGTLTEKSAFYCAKYLQKLNFSDKEVPPFVHMSLRPGIGYQAYSTSMAIDKKLYVGGRAVSLPRYYLKRLERDLPAEFDDDYKFSVKWCMRHLKDGVTAVQDLRRHQISTKWRKKMSLKY